MTKLKIYDKEGNSIIECEIEKIPTEFNALKEHSYATVFKTKGGGIISIGNELLQNYIIIWEP